MNLLQRLLLSLVLLLSAGAGAATACYGGYGPWAYNSSSCNWDFFYCFWFDPMSREYCRHDVCAHESCRNTVAHCTTSGGCYGIWNHACGGSTSCAFAENNDGEVAAKGE